MKILYFYQYFSTPKGSWGTRVYEFAKEWVQKGHEVTVVSSVYSKSDLVVTRFLETQWIDGIQVKIINVRIDNKQPILQRIYTFLVYALISSWYAIRQPADIVIASSGPITVGIPGLVARYLRMRTLVFETRDLWPEGAIELGIIKNNFIKHLAYAFERLCYKASDLIIALSPGMKQYIEERHKHRNVLSVSNAANITLFSNPEPFPYLEGLKSRSYAIYTGNIGEVNNAFWMLEAAKILQKRGETHIQLLLVGEGQQKEALKKAVELHDLHNLLILDLMPKETLVALIQHALVSLVPLKGTPVLDTSSPNKFFESLAAGVPVIQNTNGWMKDFLDRYDVGFTINPNQPEDLADCLTLLFKNPVNAANMGARGAILAKEQFDKTILSQKMLEGLLAAVQRRF